MLKKGCGCMGPTSACNNKCRSRLLLLIEWLAFIWSSDRFAWDNTWLLDNTDTHTHHYSVVVTTMHVPWTKRPGALHLSCASSAVDALDAFDWYRPLFVLSSRPCVSCCIACFGLKSLAWHACILMHITCNHTWFITWMVMTPSLIINQVQCTVMLESCWHSLWSWDGD